MKKIITIIILGLTVLNAQADMNAIQEKLERISWVPDAWDAKDLLESGNNNLAYHIEWPGSDELSQAVLIIKWDGFPVNEINRVWFKMEGPASSTNANYMKVENKTQGTLESWIFLPLDASRVTLEHPKFGSTTISLKGMKQHDVWSIPVVVDNLVNIEIKPLTDYNKQVRITLVNPRTGAEQEAMSPATFENVSPGIYNVRLAINGRNVERQIMVTPTQKIFGDEKFDFRTTKPVTFESTEKGIFLIDGAYRYDGTSFTTELPYGPHTVEVRVSDNLKDEKVIDVNEDSPEIIYFSPILSRTFEVVGMYQGKIVPTRIYVAGLSTDRYDAETEDKKHTFTLPVGGTPYKYTLYYGGMRVTKEIKVTPNMDNVQQIKLNSQHSMVWPWQRDYKNVNNWFELSYVSKQYATSGRLYDNGSSIKTTIKENGVWDDGYDHWLHGFRFGYGYQPAFKFGLGLYTGLYMELYFSNAKNEPIGDYDEYLELDLSLPLHILYQFPLGKNLCIGFHTGPSFNLAAYGSYSIDGDSSDEKWTDFWDESWAPNRFNIDWDFSLFLRWKKLMITGTLSRGMTDNKMHQDFGADAKTVMNKAIIGLSLGF